MIKNQFNKEFDRMIVEVCSSTKSGEPLPTNVFFDPEDFSHKINNFICLSVRQPWADALVRGVKDIENRSWYTKYRGLLLIQASLKFDWSGYDHPEYKKLMLEGYVTKLPSLHDKGKIIGAVELYDVAEFQNNIGSVSPWAEKGLYHWRVRNAVKFENPIVWRGGLGFWKAVDNDGHIKRELFEAYNL